MALALIIYIYFNCTLVLYDVREPCSIKTWTIANLSYNKIPNYAIFIRKHTFSQMVALEMNPIQADLDSQWMWYKSQSTSQHWSNK